MVELINRLQVLTEQIIGDLGDATFEKLEEFVAERNEIVAALQTHMTNTGSTVDHSSAESKGLIKHRETIRSILQHDAKIMKRMEELREEASKSLNKIKQGKTHRDTYDIVYSPESIYFDKKK